MLLLGPSESTTQLKTSPCAPPPLPLQRVGVLPFAMGMIKAVADGGGTELLKSQAEKKSNVLLVNSNLCCCIANRAAVGLFSPRTMAQQENPSTTLQSLSHSHRV